MSNLKKQIDDNKEKKSRFDLETEKSIDAYIATLDFDKDDPQNQFTTPELKREKMKTELQEQAKLSELSAFIETAFEILTSQEEKYLEAEQFEIMYADFDKGNDALEETKLNSPHANFQAILHFSDSTIDSIFKIAVAKFIESQLSDSLSLFVLLATLVPENPDYWLRAGILAHRSENFELATRLYSTTTALDPTLVNPLLFSIDCYLKRGMKPDAIGAYTELMKLNDDSLIDDASKEMLSKYEIILKKE